MPVVRREVLALDLPAIGSRTVLLLLVGLITSTTAAVAQFETRATITPPYGAESIAVGDFNHDGILDVAVPNEFNSTEVSVFLGNGEGTFKAPVSYKAGEEPDSIAAAVMSRSGNLDLIVGNLLSGNVSVLLGNGDGTFRSARNYDLPEKGGATFVGVGDFTGNGNLDVVTIESSSYCECIVVFLGNGDGTLQTPPVVYSLPPYYFSAFALGDFNSDGKLDLAVTEASAGDSQLQILLGDGNGSFTAGNSYLSGLGPFYVQSASLRKGSNNVDLLATTGLGVDVLLGNGDGTFSLPTSYPPGSNRLTVADFNGDGNLDVAATGNTPDGQLTLLIGNGDGTFQPAETYATGPESGFITAGDFNGDGKQDVAIVGGPGGKQDVTVLLNTGVASFSPITPINFPFQLVGSASPAQTVTLTNTGATALSISSFKTTSPFSQSNNCGKSLAAGAKCEIKITFKPQNTNTVTGTITISDSASSKPEVIEATGTGTTVKLSPLTLAFGDQKVGTTSSQQTVAVTNESSTPLSLTQIYVGGTNYQDFSRTNNCPTSLNAGATCTVTVTFDPIKTGARSAQLEFNDNGGGSPQTVNLTGIGD